MKVLKIVFLILTAIIWVPFWIVWKFCKLCSKLGIKPTFKTTSGWNK